MKGRDDERLIRVDTDTDQRPIEHQTSQQASPTRDPLGAAITLYIDTQFTEFSKEAVATSSAEIKQYIANLEDRARDRARVDGAEITLARHVRSRIQINHFFDLARPSTFLWCSSSHREIRA
jgi:hypothetical protein